MMNKEIVFFLPKQTMNEATIYYVDIVKEAFIKSGYTILQAEKISELRQHRKIFVMSAKWCFLVKLYSPRAKIVTWFQGLGAEEALMTKNSILRKRLWNCVEYFAMKFSWLNIYVSERMHKYYMDTYNIYDKNFFIMPCFNKKLNINAFNVSGKYTCPSFVYAGGLDKWQCIEETLELYSLIEKENSNASLTILTREQEKAHLLVKNYGIKNYKISFVSLENLDDELKKYKYGFLIRQNHIVNNVSTPTKMNSYLANGVIPIYTDVICDFNKNFRACTSFIKLGSGKTVADWGKDFILYENSAELIDSCCLIREVSNIFLEYYNEVDYIDFLAKKLITMRR